MAEATSFKNQEDRFLLALELDEFGRDDYVYELLRENPRRFQDRYGGLLIHTEDDIYSKEMAKEVVHVLNLAGAGWVGHPLVESIQEDKNMRKWARNQQLNREEALYQQCRSLGTRLKNFEVKKAQSLLVLHANSRPQLSNSMRFFDAMLPHLPEGIAEVEIVEEEVRDCAGCSYKTCGYYSENNQCYHGGYLNDHLFAKVEQAGALLFLAPNYNDALSAKIMAIINRLSVLYRKGPFFDKWLFAIVVSGNSGSDSVARQLIGSLNINKGFRLPPHFYTQAIANDPGEILKDPLLHEKARRFAGHIGQFLDY